MLKAMAADWVMEMMGHRRTGVRLVRSFFS